MFELLSTRSNTASIPAEHAPSSAPMTRNMSPRRSSFESESIGLTPIRAASVTSPTLSLVYRLLATGCRRTVRKVLISRSSRMNCLLSAPVSRLGTTRTYLSADILPHNMTISVNWSSEIRQLLFIGFSVVVAVALSYDYVTTEGVSDVFFAIIGAGLLLAALVIAPVLLSDRREGSD